MAKMPTMDEWVEKIGNKVINEYVYEGRTLKEWIDLMASGKLVIFPNNATNGDVIRAAFPKAEVIEKRAVVMVGISRMIVFDLDWWNAPYKAGDTDE